MKTAVLLVGNVRTWDQTRSSFESTFGTLTPDIFVSTYANRYGYHPCVQGMLQDHEDPVLAREHIYGLFHGMSCTIHIKPPFSDDYRAAIHPNFRFIDNCIGQVYGLVDALRMMREFEQTTNTRYDVVIKTRCDILYNQFDLTVPDQSIIIDSGNHVFPNDVTYMCSRDNMENIITFMDREIRTPLYLDSHEEAPHRLLLNAIRANNLNIVIRKPMRAVLRKNGLVQTYER